MKIDCVASGSIAEELQIKPGDDLLSVNGNKIRDEIDYQFYTSDDDIEILVRRNGEQILFEIEKEPNESLGIHLQDFRTRSCGNHCLFCFVDQNPKGMRDSLYFKDEDYRLSFLYGHYTTLTNTSQNDLKRIVKQRLSPLYISVHATEWGLRKFLLGLKKPDHLMEKIRFLTDHGIILHSQIVLCPGMNDGEQLKKTVFDLASFFPGVRSIAVVPVGLTKHRGGLPALRPVSREIAGNLLEQINAFQDHFQQKFDTRFVFPSDEFHILSGEKIPEEEYYEEYHQIDDGVGLIRYLLEYFKQVRMQLPSAIVEKRSLTFLCGTSAAPVLKNKIQPVLNEVDNLDVQVIAVENQFYGESVTVTGLLTGQDFARAILENNVSGEVVISSKCLNQDDLFLDDWTIEKLEKATHCSVLLMDDFLNDLPKVLRE